MPVDSCEGYEDRTVSNRFEPDVVSEVKVDGSAPIAGNIRFVRDVAGVARCAAVSSKGHREEARWVYTRRTIEFLRIQLPNVRSIHAEAWGCIRLVAREQLCCARLAIEGRMNKRSESAWRYRSKDSIGDNHGAWHKRFVLVDLRLVHGEPATGFVLLRGISIGKEQGAAHGG